MKTVRLGDQLESQLDEIARVTGEPVSQIIRKAVRRHCDELTANGFGQRLADVVGKVASAGGTSRDTGRQFTEVVKKKQKAGRRRSK